MPVGKLAFIYKPSIDKILEIFDKISNHETKTYTIVDTSDGKPKFLLEELSGYYGHLRVFLNQEDARKYLLFMHGTRKIDVGYLKIYESTVKGLIEVSSRLTIGQNDGVMLSLNDFDEDHLHIVDVLWDCRGN